MEIMIVVYIFQTIDTIAISKDVRKKHVFTLILIIRQKNSFDWYLFISFILYCINIWNMKLHVTKLYLTILRVQRPSQRCIHNVNFFKDHRK